jgi:LDH2 family malate/lactate/ureidoglycolate dehydrogenase
MNRPPNEFTRVAPEPMRAFVTSAFVKQGMTDEDAALLARLLVTNDLRGVFSHGTRQTHSYMRQIQGGELNPRPQVRVVSEQGPTFVVDGDGGLGYFPAWKAANLLVEKCREFGVAAAVTRNHGHIGAAGLYSRVPMESGQIGYVTSGHKLTLGPSQNLQHAAGGSPMSFAVPAGEEPPLVLDFGAMHDMYPGQDGFDEMLRLAPSAVFRSIGLGAVCQSVGGFLAGVPAPRDDSDGATGRRGDGTQGVEVASMSGVSFPGANQGAFLAAFDIGRFFDPQQFAAEMDAYQRQVRQLQPLPGYDRAVLAGGLEWEREREWSEIGIPVGGQHRATLAQVGAALGIALPV